MDRLTSLVAQMVKRLPTVRETRVQSPGREDLLEKEMATHSSILAWKISWTEKPGSLQSTGSQRVGHDWATSLHSLIREVEASPFHRWKSWRPEKVRSKNKKVKIKGNLEGIFSTYQRIHVTQQDTEDNNKMIKQYETIEFTSGSPQN